MNRSSNIPYQSTRHSKHLLSYHFIWCPKYRRNILDDPAIIEMVRASIIQNLESMGCTLIALEIMPDHVHLSLSAPPRFSPAYLAGKIKGTSGSAIAAAHPSFRKQKIWSRSYFVATTGTVSTETIRQYIESQWKRIK